MSKRLWIVLAAVVAIGVVSCSAPAAQKSRAKPKAKPAVSTKAPVKSKSKAAVTAKKASPKAKASAANRKSDAKSSSKKPTAGKKSSTAAKASAKARPGKKPAVLPRLVDLGATKCIPCKMMAPILEELAKEYKGKLKVEFIDVWENPGAGEKYGIRVIPTQIFFDRNGEEFFRHEGFYSKEDILRKFKDQGIDLGK